MQSVCVSGHIVENGFVIVYLVGTPQGCVLKTMCYDVKWFPESIRHQWSNVRMWKQLPV